MGTTAEYSHEKITTLIYFLVFRAMLFGQLPVSTSPQDKKILLEEFTGIRCGYCPDGHKIGDELIKKYPDKIHAIILHAFDHFSQPKKATDPDFRTPFGTAILEQSGFLGFPSGTVNRHVFPELSSGQTRTAMNRDDWEKAINLMFGKPSYVNVAFRANIDQANRLLKVDVEVYYTGNSPQPNNYLNIALLQDSVLGPQSGGSEFYPAMMVGSQYRHNKILRHLLTGQWGEKIDNTAAGSKFIKTYTYKIPQKLPETVPTLGIQTDVLLSKLKVLAFINESRQEVVTVTSGPLMIGTATDLYDRQEEYGIFIFPNPASSATNIRLLLGKPEEVSVQVFNVLGVAMYASKSNLDGGIQNIQFDVSKFEPGMYIIKIGIGNKTRIEKLSICE